MTREISEKIEKVTECSSMAGDKGVRRYRVFSYDFDSRPRQLASVASATLTSEARDSLEARHAQIKNSLLAEYGAQRFDQKIKDFIDFGAKPFSIVSYHNTMFDHVRTAFVSGAYYAALTGACALGERILNHLILDLRDQYKSTPAYKRVHNKKSFNDWDKAIDILNTWQVLLPEAAEAFRELKDVRNHSIHFNIETASRLREDAMLAVKFLVRIIETQFCAFGPQPWFIEGILGAGFIKRDWEANPFVAHYYCAQNSFVGPYHGLNYCPRHGWHFVDWPDYREFCIDDLTDEQFKDVFNNRDPQCIAGLRSDASTEE